MKKEKIIKIVLVLVLIVVLFFIVSNRSSKVGSEQGILENPFKNSYTLNDSLTSNVVVCRFDVVSDFIDGDGSSVGEIKYQTAKQKDPIPLTFSGLSGSSPVMKGNAGEVPLTILRNDDQVILLAEQTPLGDTFFYTIFKKQKVAVWQKAYVLLSSPYALVSMGYCN